MLTIKIEDSQNNQRIDILLSETLDYSRSKIQAMIKENYILVNEVSVKANYKAKVNDIITINEMEEEISYLEPEDIDIDIVYQDDQIIVVNKDCKLVVHPGAGNKTGTLVHALLYHVKDFKAIKGEI